MKYCSTRDKKLNFDFKEIFQRSLAPDGGLFIPKQFKKFSLSDLEKMRRLNYIDLATEIVSGFCVPTFSKQQIKILIKKSYKKFKKKEVVSLIKLDKINLLELYHGPTLAFKDIALQCIGNIYEEFNKNNKDITNIVVATSGDTGAAAISALTKRKKINLFVLHPYNKISKVQKKIMTTIGGSNIYNIAIKGSFDDCQKIVKQMFSDNIFRQTINMSGVNSINWARIMFQIVYYFYSFLKLNKKKINYAVPTGNFGDIYAGYMAKKMGLPIEKLIVATNENDILQRVVNKGIYKPSKVKASISPSMDIQISSNFERLLFYAVNSKDTEVKKLMKNLEMKGFFKLTSKQKKLIQKDFSAFKVTNLETKKIIKKIYLKHNFFIDPHTATGFYAAQKIISNNPCVVLGTAHPYKFLETMKSATGKQVKKPIQVTNLIAGKEKYDILKNNTNMVKKYILEKQYEN
ncbi:threonine synthase [Pelagibacteraceae bacterium]|jgi:threonine synthase|nr:threonine synthase [Pelagibacteraceae bacterium]